MCPSHENIVFLAFSQKNVSFRAKNRGFRKSQNDSKIVQNHQKMAKERSFRYFFLPKPQVFKIKQAPFLYSFVFFHRIKTNLCIFRYFWGKNVAESVHLCKQKL